MAPNWWLCYSTEAAEQVLFVCAAIGGCATASGEPAVSTACVYMSGCCVDSENVGGCAMLLTDMGGLALNLEHQAVTSDQ